MEGQDNRRYSASGRGQYNSGNSSNYSSNYNPSRQTYHRPKYPQHYNSNIQPEAYYQPNPQQLYQPYPTYNHYYRNQSEENLNSMLVDNRPPRFTNQVEPRSQSLNQTSTPRQPGTTRSVMENKQVHLKPKQVDKKPLKLSSALLMLKNDLNMDMKDVHLANELIHNLVHRRTHSDMMNMKRWVLNINPTPTHLDAECTRVDQFYHFLSCFILELETFEQKLMVLYLLHDLQFHELAYDLGWIKRDLTRFLPYLVYHTVTSFDSSNQSQKDRLLQLFAIWQENGFVKGEEVAQFQGYVQRGIFTFKPPGIPQKVRLTTHNPVHYDPNQVLRPTALQLERLEKGEAEQGGDEASLGAAPVTTTRIGPPTTGFSVAPALTTIPPPPPPKAKVHPVGNYPQPPGLNLVHRVPYPHLVPPAAFLPVPYPLNYTGDPPNYPMYLVPPGYPYLDQYLPPSVPPPPPPPVGGMGPPLYKVPNPYPIPTHRSMGNRPNLEPQPLYSVPLFPPNYPPSLQLTFPLPLPPPPPPLPIVPPPLDIPYHQVPVGVLVQLSLQLGHFPYQPIDHKLAQQLPVLPLPHPQTLLDGVEEFYQGIDLNFSAPWQPNYLDSWILHRKTKLKVDSPSHLKDSDGVEDVEDVFSVSNPPQGPHRFPNANDVEINSSPTLFRPSFQHG